MASGLQGRNKWGGGACVIIGLEGRAMERGRREEIGIGLQNTAHLYNICYGPYTTIHEYVEYPHALLLASGTGNYCQTVLE